MTSSVLYTTAAEVFAAFDQRGTQDTPMMTRIIGAVSRAIDGYMGRVEYGFVAPSEEDAITAEFVGRGNRHLYLPEFVGTPTVKMRTSINSATYDYTFPSTDILTFAGDYQRPNYNRLPKHGVICAYNGLWQKFTPGFVDNSAIPTVEVTARFGYAAVCPAVIRDAAIMMAERIYKRQRAGMGDAVYNDQLGQFAFFKELDPEVKLMLDRSRLRLAKVF